MLKSKVLTISKKQNTQDVDSSSSESDKESLKISEVTSENNSEWSDSFNEHTYQWIMDNMFAIFSISRNSSLNSSIESYRWRIFRSLACRPWSSSLIWIKHSVLLTIRECLAVTKSRDRYLRNAILGRLSYRFPPVRFDRESICQKTDFYTANTYLWYKSIKKAWKMANIDSSIRWRPKKRKYWAFCQKNPWKITSISWSSI